MQRLLTLFIMLSFLLSMPSLIRLPRFAPLMNAHVRAAAPRMMDELRRQGLWLVNIDLERIEQKDSRICFHWEHRYSNRFGTKPLEPITTCIDDEES